MAGFSVLHIFAYPWKPYSTKHMSTDPLMAPGAGYSGDAPKYQGGPLGIKAIIDAFNPWDIIKASARGFRWMFVGVKHRHQDVSYQPAKFGSTDTTYSGPAFAATGEPATELSQGRNHNYAYDDRAGLLSHSQSAQQRPTYNDDEDLGLTTTTTTGLQAPPPRAAPPGVGMDYKPSDLYDEAEEGGFHPGMGPSGSGNVHPAHRPGGGPPPSYEPYRQ